MLAVTCVRQSASDPLSGLEVGERPEPQAPDGWTTVRLRTAALNHHDVWSLRGVGLPADRLPMVLGCDGAGVDAEGNEVLVHAVVASPGWAGDETLDPRRSLLSEVHDGTLAEVVAVPRHNVVPKPEGLSWEHAACLPTAWLTAYRMLFTNAGVRPGDSVLVQGAGGGVATAAIVLGKAAGLRVETDTRNEKINLKVREHSLVKVPNLLVVGKREAEERTVALRVLGSDARQEVMTLDAAVARLSAEAIPPDLRR